MNIHLNESGLSFPDTNPGSASLREAVNVAWKTRLSDDHRRELVDGWKEFSESRGYSRTMAFCYVVGRKPLSHVNALEVPRESLNDHARSVEAVTQAFRRTLTAIRASKPQSIGTLADDAPEFEPIGSSGEAAIFAGLLG